ncbi:MAG TPA: xanthine dehydrogenase family protein molybdopterin-binding subunit [Candidatus Saccharimonadales bacterium]|nr:xanthine dehydrogenase family protein molybdopterin-binding subunit [Candidatus Saccharimonadales bacterium]
MSGGGHDDHDDHGRPAPPDAGTLEALARPEERVEGRAKVTGAARYAADHVMPGMLWARFLGSPLPHARIRSIDATRARAMPGVHAVLTGDDLRGLLHGRRLADRPVLAWDQVRFVGDRLAAVAAETVAQADAALAEIDVDLEPLPAVLDLDSALDPDAPVLHPDFASYRYVDGERQPVPHPNVQGAVRVRRDDADLEAVFASAARVFEHRFTTPRQHAGYIEPHATLVWVDEAGVIRVITTNKTPFPLRKQLMATFGLTADQIDVDAGFIGGDFGGKGYCVDEYACVALARATGRPIKAVTRYAEEIGAQNVRHAATMRLRTALDAEGNLLAHDAEIRLDGGAYAAAKPLPHLSLAGATATLAAYRIPHVRIVATTIYTNTVPGGHMRAPGEVQALFAGESHLDEIARALGEDALAFRRRVAVRDGEVGATGARFRETRAVEVLDAVARELPWDRPRRPGRGIGVAMSARHVGGGKLPLRVRLHHDGRLEILTGLPDQGSGGWTVLRRVLAMSLGVSEARVLVTKVSTADAPFDPGIGGSRITHLASRGAADLATAVEAWIDERLPQAIPDVPSGATWRDDRLVDPADGREIATFEAVTARLVPEAEPVELSVVFDASAPHGPDEPGDHDFGACAVEVEVDEASGTVRVIDALLVVDVGTVINPVAHRGQLAGGFAFGLGAALMEGLEVEDGAITTLNLGEMKLPTAGDMPPLRIVQLPTTVGPGAFGAKAAGEVTNAPVAPAIANAVADAVGIRVDRLPINAERLLAALAERQTTTGATSPAD